MNLNGKTMNPGELRTPVSICSRSVTTDTGGFPRPSWTVAKAVLAKWRNAHGAETAQANTTGAELPATVTIRYYANLDTTYAIKKGSEYYEVLSIDDIEERHEYMELKVRRVEAG